MSLAIKFGDSTDETSLSGAIYFDVVTNYTKNLSGKVTEHPIEAGASITDHYISRNPIYSVSGIISHIDFSPVASMLSLDGETVFNNQVPPAPVVINDLGAGLAKVIPGVVGQFLQLNKPSVLLDSSERFNYKLSLENFFETVMHGMFYNETRKRWENRMTPCILFELEGSVPNKPIPNLICTSVAINEDENSGDALVLNITFEQVTFVTLEKVDAPKPQKKSPTARATAEKSNKGNQNTNVNDPNNPPQERVTVEQKINEANAGVREIAQ